VAVLVEAATGSTIDIQTPPEANIDRAATIAEWSRPETQQACLDHMPHHSLPYIVRDPLHPNSDLPR
jgi:hypothetical protein